MTDALGAPLAPDGGRASMRLRRVLAGIAGSERTTVGTLVDLLGPASVGLVLLLVALAAMIPIPGPVGQLFGAAIAIIGWQVLTGVHRIWLPKWMRRAGLRTALVEGGVGRFLPWLGWIEARTTTRRWLSLTRAWVRRGLGIVIIYLGAVVAIPIPLGNIMPVIALLILSVALLERDGGAVLAGLAWTVLTTAWTAFLVISGANVVLWIKNWLGW